MTPEERDLITGLFAKLKTADQPNKDREADDLIRRQVAELPAAPYLMAQTVLVQEQALAGAQARIQELEQQLKQSQPAPAPASSFLGGAQRSGPWGSFTSVQQRPQPAAQPVAPQMPPPTMQQPMMGQPMMGGGGGFLHSALSTAAGVAGGALLFEGIRSMMGHSAGPFSSMTGGNPLGGPTEIVERETVNNYYGDSRRGGDAGAQPGGSGGIQDTDYQTDSDDSFAGGFDSSSDDSA